MPPTRSTEKVVQKPKPKPTGAATRAPSQPLDDTAQAQSDAEVSLVFMPHEDAPHDDAPRNSTPHDDTSHATASATSYSTDRVARLKAMIAAAADKAFTLACEEEQLDDSPTSLERKSRILAEMKRLNEKRRELELLMEEPQPTRPKQPPRPHRYAPTHRSHGRRSRTTFPSSGTATMPSTTRKSSSSSSRGCSRSPVLTWTNTGGAFFHLCFDSGKTRLGQEEPDTNQTWKEAKKRSCTVSATQRASTRPHTPFSTCA